MSGLDLESFVEHINDLIRGVRALSSDDRLPKLEQFTTQIPDWREDVERQSKAIEELRVELKELQSSSEKQLQDEKDDYQNRLQEAFNAHHLAVKKIEEEKISLDAEILQLREDVKTSEEKINDIAAQKDELHAQIEAHLKTQEEATEQATKQQEVIKGLEDDISNKTQQIETLQNEATSKDEEIGKLTADKQTVEQSLRDLEEQKQALVSEIENHVQMHQQHAEQSAKQQEDLKALEEVTQQKSERIQGLEEETTRQTEQIDKLSGDITQLEKDVSEVKAILEQTETDKGEALKRSKTLEERLKRLARFAEKLEEDDKLEDLFQNLKSLWDSCLAAVTVCFNEDLPESILQDSEAWKQLQTKSNELTNPIPIVQSNHEAAKTMRKAAVLAILADLLDYHIFTTSYLFLDDSAFRTALLEMADEDPTRERFCRGLLLSIGKESQNKIMNRKKSLLVKEVMDNVHGLLTEPQENALRAALKDIAQRSIDMWRSVQRRKKRFESDTNTTPEWEWLEFDVIATEDPGSEGSDDGKSDASGSEASQSSEDQPAVCVFPRVFYINGQKDEPVFPGVMVMTSQMQAAKKQLNGMDSVLNRTPTMRTGRRQSNASTNGIKDINGSFLGSTLSTV